MEDALQHRQWQADAVALAELGSGLVDVSMAPVEVRLPSRLAQVAVDAWNRDDGEGKIEETPEQAAVRGRAATLALIGLSIKERGRLDGEDVVVLLDPLLIAEAIDAAERRPS
jgi:hypothetical protein